AWDLLTGAYSAFALTAALLARLRGGGGREIRVPLSDVGAATMANLGFMAEAKFTGHQRPRMGNDLFGAFGRDFTTRDGQKLMLLCVTPRQWSKAIEALGIGAGVAALEAELGVSFATDEGLRFTHRGRLYPLFEAAFAAKDAAELAPAFDAGGVTWGAYQTLDAALEDPRLYKDNPLFQTIRHPSGLDYAAPGAMGTLVPDARGPVRPARPGARAGRVAATPGARVHRARGGLGVRAGAPAAVGRPADGARVKIKSFVHSAKNHFVSISGTCHSWPSSAPCPSSSPTPSPRTSSARSTPVSRPPA
ncbi:MAG: CoA transferase, partial [Proteobacteria bacterium]|nr:CoA transferase [Pseudomonadota bacterium]